MGGEYQSLISGKPYNRATGEIEEFNYNGVDFDGYSNGILYEAKDKYAQFINKESGEFWFRGKTDLVKQANSQIVAADGNMLQWVFSEREALDATYNLLRSEGVDDSKIEFKHIPKP